MDDLQRTPAESDRRGVRDRIAKAVADGRIGQADGDIRLTNVSSATTMAELGLIVRDLDQLEAVLPAGSAAPLPPAASQADLARASASTSSSRTVPFVILGLVVAVLVAGGVGLVVFSKSDDSSSSSSTDSGPQLPDPVSPGTTPTDEPVDTASVLPGDSGPAAQPFKLSAAGVKDFLAVYRHKFATTKVVDLTMYGDYVVVRVPVPGKARNAGWLYRDGEWSDFGGVTANFPGSATVDLRKLDVDAMVRNLARARRSLNVEDPDTSYVVINYRPDFDQAPNVNIYMANKFHESGYLATTLSGAVERSYPFSS